MSEIGNPIAIAALGSGDDSNPAALTRGARALCELETEEAPLIGHVQIGVFADGRYSIGYRIPDDHPLLGTTLFCAMVKEIIAREMTGKLAADDYAKANLL